MNIYRELFIFRLFLELDGFNQFYFDEGLVRCPTIKRPKKERVCRTATDHFFVSFFPFDEIDSSRRPQGRYGGKVFHFGVSLCESGSKTLQRGHETIFAFLLSDYQPSFPSLAAKQIKSNIEAE